jgi:hypothetical protein
MRVYHRLIHIRDQKERPDSVPEHITSHPVFRFTTDFRLHVQKKSEPISKTSKLLVGEEGLQIFGKLVEVLKAEGKRVMIFLVACILERLFGVDTIENIEGIRGDMKDEDIIDGISDDHVEEVELEGEEQEQGEEQEGSYENGEDFEGDDEEQESEEQEEQDQEVVGNDSVLGSSGQPTSSVFAHPPVSAFGTQSQPVATGASAFSNLTTTPSAFANLTTSPSPFGAKSVFGSGSVFGKPSPFGQTQPPSATSPSQAGTQPTTTAPPASTTTGFTFTTNPFKPPASSTKTPQGTLNWLESTSSLINMASYFIT